MASSNKRREEKKRRRQKRLSKRKEKEVIEDFASTLAALERQLKLPMPRTWPGGCDPSLERPDFVKAEYAEYATKKSPGRAKCDKFERDMKRGLLHYLPQLDHWSWEEFLWHGVPGDSWHPLDAFLEKQGDRFPPAAQAQLRLWKQARIGLFEIGEVSNDTVALTEWDAPQQHTVGESFRAITLNIGGVNTQRDQRGKILLTYIAPWVPEENLYCGMGYSVALPKNQSLMMTDFLGLQHAGVVRGPLPWRANRAAVEQYRREWKRREWDSWLRERMTFPFKAIVAVEGAKRLILRTVNGLLPSSPERTREFGVYFDAGCDDEEQALVVGGTAITPVDVTSRNRMALAEYQAYRNWAGPPPGVRNQPHVLEIDRR